MLRERRFRDGVVVPVPPEGAPETPETVVDPMSDPGIDAVETHGETAFRQTGDEADEGGDGEPERPDRPPLITYPAHRPQPQVPGLDAYSLRLVTGRPLYDEGTLVQQSPALARLVAPLRLRVNPYDLDRLGLTTGGRVRLTAPRAGMIIEVEADDGVPRGSAFLPFNVGRPSAADLIDTGTPATDIRIETVT
jgi:anaerobic selenocysteine-containing dehydrogenase